MPHYCCSRGLHWLHGKDVGGPHYSQAVTKVLTFHQASSDTIPVPYSDISDGNGSPGSPTSLLWHCVEEASLPESWLSVPSFLAKRFGLLVKASHGWESRPCSACPVWAGVGSLLSEVFSWSRAFIISKVSVSLGCSFGQKEQAFIGFFFFLVNMHWHFQVASFFKLYVWDT